jgi:outer membrane receptor protein involved in Fe transport
VKIGGGMSYFSSRYPSGDYANAADKLKGYVLFDISAYYEPCWAKGLKFSLTLSNLFDRNYCDWAGVGYYYPACGRSVSFTVSYEF